MTFFGWIGNACLITGAWRQAKKHRHAYAFSICGGLCWLHEAWQLGRADWLFIEVVMLVLATRNYWHWIHDVRSTADIPARPASDQ